MIKKLAYRDIKQVSCLHTTELSGFLPQLGKEFLEKFYQASFSLPDMFTFVEKEKEKILGFATGCLNTKGLYRKIIIQDVFGFSRLLLRYLVTHPKESFKIIKTLSYPGFDSEEAELLSIAVGKQNQKKGRGRKLFFAVSHEFRKRGIKQFKISAYDRLSANGFYRKIGCRLVSSFSFLGEKMNYYTYPSTSPD